MMPARFAIAWLFSLCLLGSGCKDDPPIRTGPEPMRAPPGGSPRPLPDQLDQPDPIPADESVGEPGDAEPRAVVLPERPRADPDIERALDLISGSGLRFIDSRSDPNERPTEYTAEQFATMLRTKWDWLGYDLIALDPWLDEIATRSFKTSLPYRVVFADGTTSELRPWLDRELRNRPTDDR